MELTSLQREFSAYVLQQLSQIEEHVSDQPPVPVSTRLDIYRSGYIGRLTEILRIDFPLLAQVMDEEAFDTLCHHYLTQFPPHSYEAKTLGAYLPVCLKQQGEEQANFYAEIARFEYVLLQSEAAPNQVGISFEQLQAISPENWPSLTFAFHPSVQVLLINARVLETWQQWQNNSQINLAFTKKNQPIWVVIWRKQWKISVEAIDVLTAHALQQMIQGCDLNTISEWLSEQREEAAAIQQLLTWLNDWFARQWIIRVMDNRSA